MSYSVILHVAGEAAILGEVDELPKPTDNIVTILNPRQRDGKDLHYIDNNVVKVIWPIAKISFIEILESADEEKIIGFVRE
ncbi:hypothetical protein ANAEL_01230 [Anaerolineales bacterium]|nr:hypothetical protein ANAEL_01230 [Anaerolineales bacterium]